MDEKKKKELIGHLDQFKKKLGGLTELFSNFEEDYTKLDAEDIESSNKELLAIIKNIASSKIPTGMKLENGVKEIIIDGFNHIDRSMNDLINIINLYKDAKTNYDRHRIYFIIMKIMKRPYNQSQLKRMEAMLNQQLTNINEVINHINVIVGEIISYIEKLKEMLNMEVDHSHVDITSKVYPTPFDNSKGFRIGDFKVAVDTTALPFTNTDQVNHYLYNLFDYTSYQGIPKMSRKQDRKLDSFFSAKKTKLEAYKPIKYPDLRKAKYVEREQKVLQEENRKIRENMRKIQNELAEMGFSGDTEKRREIVAAIKNEIDKDKDKKETILSEYLNAIDEVENEGKGFTLPFLTATGKNKGEVIAGGKRKTRGNQRKRRATQKRNVTKRKR